MDIDYFKQVNDQCGHAYGDEVLIRIARQVEQPLSPQALFGGLGGDEFLIFVPNSAGAENLIQLAKRILQNVEPCFPKDRGVIMLSIGIALYQHCGNDFRSLY